MYLGGKMSSDQKHHEELVNGFHSQLKQIFDSSEQAIYLYLDDTHKVCNKKYATLLGYNSPEEWAKIENPLETTVDKTSQQTVVSAYRAAMEKMVGSKIDIKVKKKSGGTVNATVIMVPVAYQGHLFALHFISEKK
jgi:carbohydrate-binding DOMON domain-containing protein